jgi:Cu(I)/Ag(I) efflux system membrane protein CusA/SilA
VVSVWQRFQKAIGLGPAELTQEISIANPRVQTTTGRTFNPDYLTRIKGLKEYDKVRRDDQVKAALAFKKLAVLKSGWTIDSPEEFGDDWEVAEFARVNLEKLAQTPLKTMPDGTRVTLGMVADVFESNGPNLISRENMMRRIVVSANVGSGDLDHVVKKAQKDLADNLKLESGYFIQYGGQFESQRDAFQKLFWLGLLSLGLVFFVLYSHFRSAFIVFQILLNIPLALIGSVIAIFLTGKILSVATFVAFITLCGIASRNGIMMISHYLHLLKEDRIPFSKELVIRGSQERLIPVLMTALTAALALLPLALSAGAPGKEILHPVAVVIMGGLLSSTLLDIVVTPVVFYHFGRKSAERHLAIPSAPEVL